MDANKIIGLNLLKEFKKPIDATERKADEFFEESDSNNSSSESDEEMLLNAAATSTSKRRKILKIVTYTELVVGAYDEQQFQENFRLTRDAFEFVLREVSQQWKVDAKGRNQIPIKKQLLAVVWLLVTPDSYRLVSERFDLSKSNLSLCFIRVINALNQIAPKFIKWPTSQEMNELKNEFGSNSPFKNLIGVIDGTYVPIKAPKSQVRAYTNRKAYCSMTLQCICDCKMKYIDCYTGWPSSVPDVRVFKNSDIFVQVQTNERVYFPNGEYILGDKAYPCLSWCIPPYLQRRKLTSKQVEFNKKHASVRVVIENSFALLFGRFRRLRYLDMTRTDWIPSTILACCVLHNICLDFKEVRRGSYMNEGRAILQQTCFDQKNEDLEAGAVDGNTKRDSICNERIA